MEKYKISIEETIVQSFEITANSGLEAKQIAASRYANGDLVVDNGQLETTSIHIDGDDSDYWERIY